MTEMKKGNKGFSLVEVMIAITILAIIVTPFLASFLRATKINAKSRKMLRATTVAENVMEGLSGFLIEDISKQFNNSYFLQAKDADGKPLVDASGKPVLESDSSFLILSNRGDDDAFTYEELGPNKTVVTEVDGAPVDRDKRVFTQKPDNVYEYIIRNVTEDKQKFDVKVTIDANKYRDVAGEKLQTGQDYNIAAGKMFNVSEMNPRTDIVWSEPAGMENRYQDDYIAGLRTAGYESETDRQEDIVKVTALEKDDFLKRCERNFEIYLNDNEVRITVRLKYTDADGGVGVPVELESSKKYFPSVTGAEKRANLKNIFLCYYPKYQLVKDVIQIYDDTGFDEDKYEYNPREGYNYNLYIIKQKMDAEPIELDRLEENYKVDLNIYSYAIMWNDFWSDSTGITYDTEYAFPFVIRGNLGHYFEKENPAAGEKQGLIPGQVTIKVDNEDGELDASMTRSLEPEELEAMDILYDDSIDDYVISYSGIDRSTKNLIYNTVVDVYESEACTIYPDGTYKFDESKHIAKLDSEQAEIE